MTVQDDVAGVERRMLQIFRDGDRSAWKGALDDAQQGAGTFVRGAERAPEIPAASAAAQRRIEALVRESAARWNLDPALVSAVIANESAFDAAATSRAGAIGLMQLMPATAATLGVRDPYDPAQNIAGGARYLRSLLDRFGNDERLALAAYNAGPQAVANHHAVPPYAETQHYVAAVLASRDVYRRR